MKKFLLTALVVVSLTSSSFAATGIKVGSAIRSNFESEFKRVKDVDWTSNNQYVTATFVLNDKKTQAFYEFNGNLIGTSSAITIDDLPTIAKRTFAKKYGDYTVIEAIQFNKPEEVSYFISAQNEKESVILKVVDGQISIFRKNKS